MSELDESNSQEPIVCTKLDIYVFIVIHIKNKWVYFPLVDPPKPAWMDGLSTPMTDTSTTTISTTSSSVSTLQPAITPTTPHSACPEEDSCK